MKNEIKNNMVKEQSNEQSPQMEKWEDSINESDLGSKL